MKTKLTVQTPIGTVTRTTERPYKFVVVSLGKSPEAIEQIIERRIEYKLKQLEEYEQVVESGHVPAAYYMLTLDDYRRFVESDTRELEKLTSAEYMDQELTSSTRLHDWLWTEKRQYADRKRAFVEGMGYQQVMVVEVPQA